MDICVLRSFFLWCTVLNAGLLIISSVFLVFARDRIYKRHNKWFPMKREVFDVIIYCFIGIYKIFFPVFNVVPYAVLGIMG